METRLRILIVTGIFPPDLGGPATSVSHVARTWSEGGHRVTVVTLADSPEQRGVEWPFRVERVRRSIPKPWRQLKTIVAILRAGRNSDVVFINGLAFEANVANALLRRRQVQKVVGDKAWEMATNTGQTTNTFEDFQRAPQSRAVERLRRLRARWTRRADAVIVPSRYLERIVVGWGVREERVAVVYNAVDDLEAGSPAVIPLETTYKLVSVGRLVPWKGLDRLIGVVARLPDVGLAIVGDGPERRRLETTVRQHDCADRVWFAGQRDRRDALRIVAGADLFVLNSTYEGFPHVVLEAQMVGTPVIATDAGGTSEAVVDGETGRLVPVDDPPRLASGILTLLRDTTLRNRMTDCARSRAGSLTWDRAARETLAVLRGGPA